MITKSTPDPREQYPKPPMPKLKQAPPGTESEMRPKPDYGTDSYKGSGKLEGKIALITGGDSGIGRAVALAFAREGADIAISYLSEHDDAEETRAAIESSGRSCLLIPGDVADETHCRDIVEQSIKEFGKLDILVNNAAYQMSYDSIDQVPSDEFDRTMKVNLYAPFFISQAALSKMKPGSAIINTASIQAYDPDASLMPYAMTKGAIVNLTKSLAQEAIKKGVRVNAVAPGPVWTPLIPSSDMDTEGFGSSAPIGRAAQPIEMAPLYVLLASSDADYVVGQVWGATGGNPTA